MQLGSEPNLPNLASLVEVWIEGESDRSRVYGVSPLGAEVFPGAWKSNYSIVLVFVSHEQRNSNACMNLSNVTAGASTLRSVASHGHLAHRPT